jgi:2-keto-4-pentenoate hydratase/2-oxohepta-3-ene-1,7-dioic acid hydratase in catechol pathway
VSFEGEIGTVMAKDCPSSPPMRTFVQFVLGYTIVNDFTARDLHQKIVGGRGARVTTRSVRLDFSQP